LAPTCLPIVVRRCHRCASGHFRANGNFRVNANRKLLNTWLFALCTGCGDTGSKRCANSSSRFWRACDGWPLVGGY